MPLRLLESLLLSGVFVLTLGCASKDSRQKACFPVEGQVLVKSQPAAGALVILQPPGANAEEWIAGYPRAVADSGGTFHIETYEKNDGAPAGNYIVLITWPAARDPADEEATPRDRLDGKYSDPKSAQFKAKVESGPTKLPPFNIP